VRIQPVSFPHAAALATVSLLAISFFGSAAHAQRPYIDETIAPHIAHGLPPTSLVGIVPARPGPAAVVIALRQPADDDALRRLATLGVEVQRVGNRPLVVGPLVSARIDAAALANLRRASFVDRVLRAPAGGRLPLERSREASGLSGLGLVGRGREGLTGEGVVIGNVDTIADVFHPDFFFADGGWHSWIDVDGDGRFTPGVDGVDLDGDGAPETLHVLRASPIDISDGSEVLPVRPAGFDPSLDWLYIDADGNSARDRGATFGDETPAFGEPLFVPDDVDGDGVLDPEDRIVRLGTSKFRKILVALGAFGIYREHTRGTDMSHVLPNYTGAIYGYADGLHGTGVLGIAAGGVALPSRRWRGFAPNAELVLAWGDGSDLAAPAMWAAMEGADVLLHEGAVWTSYPLDGSDAWSTVIDTTSMTDDITHICPVGNIAGARKHAVVTGTGGAPAAFPLSVRAATRMVTITFQVVEATGIVASVVEPGGTRHEIDGARDYFALADEAGFVYVESSRSPRGTAVMSAIIFGDNDFARPVPSGTYTFEVAGNVTVHGSVSDSETSFGEGAAFATDIATDASTAALPSIADHCTRVGAIPAHLASEGSWASGGPEAAGVVRVYSGRGPRIDGAPLIDVVAPDNPFVPMPAGDLFPSIAPGRVVIPPGGYGVFGGTSGAAPHVAGVAALLAQTGVQGVRGRDALRAGADATGLEAPNEDYGYGRLDAARTLGAPATLGATPAVPTIRLEVDPVMALPGTTVTVNVVLDDADDPLESLEVRWDEGYDGTWDTELEPAGPSAVVTRTFVQSTTPLRLKVLVRDPHGHAAEAALLVPVGAPPVLDAGTVAPPTDAGVTPVAPDDDDDGCGCSAGSRPHSTLLLFLLVAGVLSRRRR
jgi:MYXO-CTERM domain-containing protein